MEYCSWLKHDTADTDLLKMVPVEILLNFEFFCQELCFFITKYTQLLCLYIIPVDDLISWNSGFCFDVMCDDVIMDNKLLEDYNLDQKVIK